MCNVHSVQMQYRHVCTYPGPSLHHTHSIILICWDIHIPGKEIMFEKCEWGSQGTNSHFWCIDWLNADINLSRK